MCKNVLSQCKNDRHKEQICLFNKVAVTTLLAQKEGERDDERCNKSTERITKPSLQQHRGALS